LQLWISLFLFIILDKTNNLSICDDSSSSEDEEEIESPVSLTEDDYNQRKSVQLKKYSNSISEEWDISKEKMRKSLYKSPETDLTGPDYCDENVGERTDGQCEMSSNAIAAEANEDVEPACVNSQIDSVRKKIPVSSVNNSPLRKQKSLSNDSLKTPTKEMQETAVFYARLDENDRSPVLQKTSEPLNVEDLESNTLKRSGTLMINDRPPSPSDQHKPKLWSCFPAIKTGSKRNSYKMVTQSPPYMPVSRENTSRFVFFVRIYVSILSSTLYFSSFLHL